MEKFRKYKSAKNSMSEKMVLTYDAHVETINEANNLSETCRK